MKVNVSLRQIDIIKMSLETELGMYDKEDHLKYHEEFEEIFTELNKVQK